MNKSLVYLAVPYSHPDQEVMEERFRKVNIAAAKLIAEGYFVYSPISHNHPVKHAALVKLPDTWEFWEKYDFAFLSCCHRLFVLALEGWNKSVGVTAEIKYANDNDIPVYYLTEHYLK